MSVNCFRSTASEITHLIIVACACTHILKHRIYMGHPTVNLTLVLKSSCLQKLGWSHLITAEVFMLSTGHKYPETMQICWVESHWVWRRTHRMWVTWGQALLSALGAPTPAEHASSVAGVSIMEHLWAVCEPWPLNSWILWGRNCAVFMETDDSGAW